MVSQKKQIKKQTKKEKIVAIAKRPIIAIKSTADTYLSRRPHRSFRRTRRRDYARSLKLPGYWSFTSYVLKTLWAQRKTFLLLALLYAVLTAVLVGTASQDLYTTLSDSLRSSGDDISKGNWGELGNAGLLLVTTIGGGASATLTDVQQVYSVIVGLLAWLTTVWLLRNILAGHKVKLRDGLYNSGAPLLSTFLVGIILVVQLLPLALAVIGYSAAASSGLLDGGVEAMLFWIAAILLAVLSLYWITSTLIALVVVTLPGMYPIQALRTAGDLVIGRRIRVLLRMLWLGLGVVVVWAVTMLSIILFDTWLKSLFPAIQWLPLVPITLLVLSSLTVIWSASYIYLLYRRIVSDDAAPA